MAHWLLRTLPFRLLAFTLFAAVLTTSAQAQDLNGLAASLGASSPLVVTGRVAAIESRWDPSANAIYTYITVTVAERLKGQLAEPEVVIKQLGGQVGDIGLRVGEQATYSVGEDVLVFLAVRPRDGTLYPAGFQLGKWRLLPDLTSGQLRAVPPAAVSSGLAGPAAISATRGLDLTSLRSIVAQTAPLPGGFVTKPAETKLASPAFALLPTGGAPARWHQVDDDQNIQVIARQPPPNLPGGEAELQAALGLWNNGETRLTLTFIGAASVPQCADFTGDRRITLYSTDECGEISNADPNTAGIGGGYFTAGDRRTVNGTVFDAFIQGIVLLNDTGPHLSSAGCFQDALTHNFGHAVGLGHTDSAGSIMRATLNCPDAPHSLGADDVSGLKAIYPNVPSGGAPPLPPINLAGSAALSTATITWTPNPSGGPPATYLLDAGTAPGVFNIGTYTIPAPSTSLVVTNVPMGIYYVRVRARNVLGTSAASATIPIDVGNCTPPGPPAVFNFGVADQNVSLAWTPPDSGVTQGYVLAAGTAPGLQNVLVAPFPASVTALNVLAPYGDYYVRVFATNVCGTSAPTPDRLISVQPCTAAPNPPSGLTFGRDGQQVTFNWNAPASGPAPTQYVFVVGSQPGAGDILAFPTGSAATSVSAVGPPGTYYVRAYAANVCGGSGFSNEVTVVIP